MVELTGARKLGPVTVPGEQGFGSALLLLKISCVSGVCRVIALSDVGSEDSGRVVGLTYLVEAVSGS